MSPQSVDRARAPADEVIANAMQCHCWSLFKRFHRHKAHARPLDRLAARFSISGVVLVGLDIWTDKFRRHQPDVVTETCDFARPMIGTRTSLQSDKAWR